MTTSEPFESLATADLIVDRGYEGGTARNIADDPLQRLLPVGNQGGFRYNGSLDERGIRLVVLYTNGQDPDWPDSFDPFTGSVTYFGDNKHPGRELHDTQRRGNEILRRIFDLAHGDEAHRAQVPPVLVFSKADRGRDVIFRGLAVPGAPTIAPGDDLVAIWRVSGGRRFQNYRATFTILDEPKASRQWLDAVLDGSPLGSSCPSTWRKWVASGTYEPLITERIDIRTRVDQLPADGAGRKKIDAIHHYFNVELGNPTGFEAFAVGIWQQVAPNIGAVDLTRPWRDGGRDAVGSYLLGPAADRIAVEFALEAKCYAMENAVGVREMSRLISRLRFRQFGVFVTTSYFNRQAYNEVRADQHPVVLICATDIVAALGAMGLMTASQVREHLRSRYPS